MTAPRRTLPELVVEVVASGAGVAGVVFVLARAAGAPVPAAALVVLVAVAFTPLPLPPTRVSVSGMSTTHTAPKLVETTIASGEHRGIRYEVRHVTEYRGRPADYFRAIVSGEPVALGSNARFGTPAEALAATIRIAGHDADDRDGADRATLARIARSAGVS